MLDEHVAVAMPRAIVTAEPEPELPRKRQADTSTMACATALVDLPSHARVSPERQSDDETAVPDEWVAPPAAASGSDESLLDEDNTPCPTSVEASPIQPPAKVGRDLSDTAAAATAAADAVQQALMAVKQERDVLTEREHALKRQRSKADSRARRRQRMLRLGEHDPVTQERRLRQIQQDQYYQSHRQGTMRPPQSRAARESSVGGLLEDALAEFQHVQQLRRPSVPSMSFFPNGGMHPATMPPAMMMAPAGDAPTRTSVALGLLISVRNSSEDAVRLLNVDVRPHVGGEGGGQRVEGDALDAVHQLRHAQRGEGVLIGGEHLDLRV